NIFRIVHQMNDIEVVGISDLADPKAMEYLLKFDTVFGRFPDPVALKGDNLYVKGRQIHLYPNKQPGEIPWGEIGADIVVDATAKYRSREDLEKHLSSGAKRVIVSSPVEDKDIDSVIIRGVNDSDLKKDHKLISTSSVTTNCLAPILKI